MKKLIELQKMIYPDLLEAMDTRFKILYSIFLFEHIERSVHVEQTKITERYIRNEIELIQMQGLIKVTTQGMYITDNGKLIINNLDDFIREFSRITSIENKLKKLFNIVNIIDL